MTRREWLLAAAAFAAGFFLVFTWPAQSHETMGAFKRTRGATILDLWGRKVGQNPVDQAVYNCCLHVDEATGQRGDCKLVEEIDVEVVPGGYRLRDGEVIRHEDTNVSPQAIDGEYYFYRCRNNAVVPGNVMKSHCFFAPPKGM